MARILVVDDENMICLLMQEFLGAVGFEVITASSAAAALEEISKNPAFDVVLCDVEMPGMNGWDFRVELSRLQSPLVNRFIFMSGYVANKEVFNKITADGLPFLEKPPRLSVVERTCRAVIKKFQK